MNAPGGDVVELSAPAKLTLSLRVTGVRPDGYHLLESEMVSLDLADTLRVQEGDGLTVTGDAIPVGHRPPEGWMPRPVDTGPDNLVTRALVAVGRSARVDLVKRIPPGAGLGGGSADAAAILRWAGRTSPFLAAEIGADVPFCVTGGRALVRGIGDEIEPLAFEERSFVLLLLPFGVDTGAVYRAYDRLSGGAMPAGPGPVGNDLEAPAVAVEPRLGRWRDALCDLTGRPARLAGSGSTWFVEGPPEEMGLEDGVRTLVVGQETGLLVPVRTSPVSW